MEVVSGKQGKVVGKKERKNRGDEKESERNKKEIHCRGCEISEEIKHDYNQTSFQGITFFRRRENTKVLFPFLKEMKQQMRSDNAGILNRFHEITKTRSNEQMRIGEMLAVKKKLFC